VALLKAGYWPTTYWSSQYWQEDYWPEYGFTVPPPLVSVPPALMGPRRRIPKRFELTVEETGTIIMVIARRRRHAKHN
jgi:hypothetical protein